DQTGDDRGDEPAVAFDDDGAVAEIFPVAGARIGLQGWGRSSNQRRWCHVHGIPQRELALGGRGATPGAERGARLAAGFVGPALADPGFEASRRRGPRRPAAESALVVERTRWLVASPT